MKMIDFKKRTINGISYTSDKPRIELKDCLLMIECLYAIYKRSTPTENDDPNAYFYAMKSSELTDEELVLGADRYKAKLTLELFVLDSIVNGSLYWDNNIMGGNWYWQSKVDPDLVLLREWIDN